jgi:hypothetical protein
VSSRGAALLGIGFSVFLSVDFAIPTEALPAATDRTEVLPTATDRGKALGVINATHSVRIRANQNPLVGDGGQRQYRQAAPPQVLAPAVAAPIIAWLGGYRTRYAVAAVVGLAVAILVHRIRSVPDGVLRPALCVCSSLLVVTVDNRLPAASGAHTLDLVRRYAGGAGVVAHLFARSGIPCG